MRACEMNSFADTQVTEEGGTGRATSAGAEAPLQPGVLTMVVQLCP